MVIMFVVVTYIQYPECGNISYDRSVHTYTRGATSQFVLIFVKKPRQRWMTSLATASEWGIVSENEMT